MLSGKTRNSHLRLNEPDKSNNHRQGTVSAKQSPEESSEKNQVDVVLYRHGFPHSLHRAGGDHAELHLGLPGQGGGEEHVLQRGQHHQLLRGGLGLTVNEAKLFSRVRPASQMWW